MSVREENDHFTFQRLQRWRGATRHTRNFQCQPREAQSHPPEMSLGAWCCTDGRRKRALQPPTHANVLPLPSSLIAGQSSFVINNKANFSSSYVTCKRSFYQPRFQSLFKLQKWQHSKRTSLKVISLFPILKVFCAHFFSLAVNAREDLPPPVVHLDSNSNPAIAVSPAPLCSAAHGAASTQQRQHCHPPEAFMALVWMDFP